MNKIDVFLNSISEKHFNFEVLGPFDEDIEHRQRLKRFRVHAALLAAFEGGVSHAANLAAKEPILLIKDVDIDLAGMR